MRRLVIPITCVVLGCSPAGAPPAQAPAGAPGIARPLAAEPLHGKVDLSVFGFQAQATMGEVAKGATVSLIDSGSNETKGATVTTPDGRFVLQFSGGFMLVADRAYYLEAVKGLNDNAAGASAARVRTIVMWQSGGWASLGSDAADGIVLNTSTTALSAIASLRSGSEAAVSAASLIGKLRIGAADSSLSPATPDTLSPVPNASNADYHAAWGIISQALKDSTDPLAAIGLDSGTNSLVSIDRTGATAAISGINPASGKAGSSVTISGKGFGSGGAGNVVKFGGSQAIVASAGGGQLVVTVPDDAVSGELTVRVGNLVLIGPAFSVLPAVAAVNPGSATTGQDVTIDGSGFDPDAADNVVTFGGAQGIVKSATATRLTVTVPAGAISGDLTVATGGGTASAPGGFAVLPEIAGLNPASGAKGAAVTISGTGFGSAAGKVAFNGVEATVASWSNTSISATVPGAATTGNVVVTTAAGDLSAGAAFRVDATMYGGHRIFDNAGTRYYSYYWSRTLVPSGFTRSNGYPVSDARVLVIDGSGTYLYLFTGSSPRSVRKFAIADKREVAYWDVSIFANGIALDNTGEYLYLMDTIGSSAQIYRLDIRTTGTTPVPWGAAMGISTPWGWRGFSEMTGLASDGQGNLYFGACTPFSWGTTALRRMAPDKTVTSLGTVPIWLGRNGVAVDGEGNVYLSGDATQTVYKYTKATNAVTSFGTLTAGGGLITLDGAGDIWVAGVASNKMWRMSGTSGVVLDTFNVNEPLF